MLEIKDKKSERKPAPDLVDRNYVWDKWDDMISEFMFVHDYKSAKALTLAKFFLAEAPSVDARQLYRDMQDIEGYQE